MASTTIIAPAPQLALEQARLAAERQAELDGYEIFRRLKDDYEEAPRPSADDVESVLSVVAAALADGGNQRTFEATTVLRSGWENVFGASVPGGMFAPGYGQGMVEGRTWFLRLSPGVMGLRCSDENKKERAHERQQERDRKAADALAVSIVCTSCPLYLLRPARGAVGEIREWSKRSRSRMAELVGSLDYSEWSQEDGALAMVTLTLPDRWQEVAPDGKTFKKLLKRFELRWRRNVGPWRLLWKLEFQRRGAPHWHALMRVPALVERQTFEEWLAVTWADVVGASKVVDRFNAKGEGSSEYSRHIAAHEHHAVDFSGKEFSDPRRISMYFLGHSAKTTDGKEYQHKVPEEWQAPGKGPGRFWGNPGLASASREIEVTERDAVEAARILRKVKKGRAWTVAVLRDRGKLPVGDRAKHRTFDVELRQREGKKSRYQQARINKKRAAAAAAAGEEFVRRPQFVPSSLGAGGYAVGGWVLVNDGLQLGLDVARWFDRDPGVAPASNLGRGTIAQRRETVALCRAARGAAPRPFPLSTLTEA